MFVRVKKKLSGSSSVLVVRKASGRYIVVKNPGVASDEKAIESLCKKGEEWIRLHTDPLPNLVGLVWGGVRCRAVSVGTALSSRHGDYTRQERLQRPGARSGNLEEESCRI